MDLLKSHKIIRNSFDPRKTSIFKLFLDYPLILSTCSDISNFSVCSNNNNMELDISVSSKYLLRRSFPNFLLKLLTFLCSLLLNRNNNVDIFLLGSQLSGSNHAVGFSDYDIVFAIKLQKLSIFNTLYIHLINRVCYALCPFQHHASFFIFQTQNNKYCSPYLPLGAFVEIMSLTSPTTKSIVVNNPFENSYSKDRFQNVSTRIKSIIKLTLPSMPVNQLQYLLALTLMLPTLDLQARGFLISKKDSFFSPYVSNRKNFSLVEFSRAYCFKIYKTDCLFLFLPILIFPRFSILFYYLESIIPFLKKRNYQNRNFVYNAISKYIHDQ